MCFFGHSQKMNLRLWIYILKNNDFIVFKHLVTGQLTSNYFAENTILSHI